MLDVEPFSCLCPPMIHTAVTPKHGRRASSPTALSDGTSDSDSGVILEEEWTCNQNLIGIYSRNTWLSPGLPGLIDILSLSAHRDLDWCGRGGSHVDFQDDETVPLLQGRFLGHGSQGRTVCSPPASEHANFVTWNRRCIRNYLQRNYLGMEEKVLPSRHWDERTTRD